MKVALPDFTGICSADMYTPLPQLELVEREYLFHYLLTDMFTLQAAVPQQRTGVPKINGQKLCQIRIPLPEKDKAQRKIAGMLGIVDAKIVAEEDRKAALEALFKSMLHQLMTGQLRLLRDEGLEDVLAEPASIGIRA